MRLVTGDIEALTFLSLIPLLIYDDSDGAFYHITELFALVRVVRISRTAGFYCDEDRLHLILLGIWYEPADLILEIRILLDGKIVLSVDDSCLGFLFEKMGEMIKGAKRYFLQRFTDRDSVPYGNLSAPSFDEMRKYAEISRKYVPETELRGVE